MAMVDLLKRLEGLLDREAIRHCLMRYSRAIERVDEALLREVYWPEAIDNHGSYNGSADGFISWVIPMLGTMTQTAHFLGNILIEERITAPVARPTSLPFIGLPDPTASQKKSMSSGGISIAWRSEVMNGGYSCAMWHMTASWKSIIPWIGPSARSISTMSLTASPTT